MRRFKKYADKPIMFVCYEYHNEYSVYPHIIVTCEDWSSFNFSTEDTDIPDFVQKFVDESTDMLYEYRPARDYKVSYRYYNRKTH